MSSSGMGGDVNSLMLSIQHFLCRAARMQFFFLDSSKYLTFGRNYLRLTIGLSISEGQSTAKTHLRLREKSQFWTQLSQQQTQPSPVVSVKGISQS